ncbi:hypothetical protein BX666DRAFT_1877564 [Dichotomocladium elegans]|nr:hypothetical protein BX666DRAFT_1877564 [Dichotomocladium elegans]
MTSVPIADTHALAKLPTSFLPNPRRVTFNSEATKPVLHPRKVVVAYEQTKHSDAILDRAIRTGLIEPEDHIYLVHISQQTNFGSLLTPSAAIGTMPSYDADLQRREIENQQTILRDFQNVVAEVIQGDPKHSLVDYCLSVKPTFLVTGSRGRGRIGSSILGSVSEYLARHCPCPVMIIKVTEADIEARKEQYDLAHSIFQNSLAKFGLQI